MPTNLVSNKLPSYFRSIDNNSRRVIVGAMSCRFFMRGKPPNKTAAVLSVFLFGGNLRIKPPLHELPLLLLFEAIIDLNQVLTYQICLVVCYFNS
jgi:hypothetical protein